MEAQKMCYPSESIVQAEPPLLALPVELKLAIISHLPQDEFPTRACLRRTHSSFLTLIPKTHVRSPLSDVDLPNQLLKTELEYVYLLPADHYPCYFCARVLPLEAFEIDRERPFDDIRKRYRRCTDCHVLKISRRPFIETLIWIGCTMEDLPMPPSRPRLRSPTCTQVNVRANELSQHLRELRQQAKDHAAIAK